MKPDAREGRGREPRTCQPEDLETEDLEIRSAPREVRWRLFCNLDLRLPCRIVVYSTLGMVNPASIICLGACPNSL